MKKRLFLLQALALVISVRVAFSQGIVSVNPLTGSASANIPITKVTAGQVSIPISLSYSSSGVKALDIEGAAGMGWQLNAGGEVSRVVRGLPDDVLKDIAGNNRYGWMSSSNTAAAAIGSFTIQNDGLTCSNETTDNSAISTSFPFNYDTEPDMFYVNAPGISCKMVYDRSTNKFVTISHEDLIITYATDFFGLITSFTVIDDKGITYVFSALETVTATANSSSGTPAFFATQYKQYQYGINYNSGWYLTSMTDPQGNAVNMTYTTAGVRLRVGSNPVSLYMPGSTTSTLQYTLDQRTVHPVLSTMKPNNANAVNQTVTFNWINSPTNQSVVSSIEGMGRGFSLGYGNVQSTGSVMQRYFLFQLTDYGCATPINYQFNYGGLTLVSGSYTAPLGDSTGYKVDYWGYPAANSNTSLQPKVLINPSNTSYQRYSIYNASTTGGSYAYSTTNGQDRSADLTQFNVGDLTTITYANGGTTTITYEPNTFKDVPSGQVIAGGGVRVKQITDYDGIDVTKNMVHNYSYNDPSTGVTSGKPVSLPIYAFTIPYSGSATGQSLWDSNTVLSDNDLSNEDHSIMYAYFKVSQTGAGSTLSQFYLPATNWDNSANPGCSGCSTADWAPTVNYVGRGNCSSTYGPMGNSSYSYPFIPNPNYDHERGLLQKVTNYNDAGTEVSETSYTYQRPFSPSVITAFKYDDNSNGSLTVRAYNKYSINYNTAELTSTVTKKVYDSATLTTAQTNTINYTYGSSPTHLLPTQQSTTNSDNSIVTTNYRYTKDYSVSTGSNPNVNAIYSLQQQNINTVVERWDQVTRGGTTKTISGNLMLFSVFSPGSLPSQQLKFVQPAGTTGFTPYSISGSTQTIDPLYIPVANYTSYDNTGLARTMDDGRKNQTTIIKDHATSNITATFVNAAYDEIGFSDFDTDPVTGQACNFTISGSGSFAAHGSHTGLAYGLGTSQTLSKTITSRNMKVSNYIFSIWINAATSGTLSFSLSGGGTASASRSFSSGGWTYYEWILPVSAMSSTFTLSVTTSAAISVDDILFYPDIARVNTSSYDPKNGYLVAQTNTNGVSTYYKKDQWGRLLFQYDQDKNIVKKQTYVTSATTGLTLASPYPGFSGYVATMPTTMTATNTPCLTPVTYTWDFGDGSPTVTEENGYTQQHTYATASTFTVTVTATHPILGTLSQTGSITTIPPPLVPQVCQSGVVIWSNFLGAPTRIATCGSNPSDAYNSYYTVTSVTGSGFGTISYTWQISYNNGVTWSTYGTGTQITVPVPSTPVSYKVRCNVTSTSGQTGTSAILQFSAL